MTPNCIVAFILICTALVVGGCKENIDLLNGSKVDRIEIRQFKHSGDDFKIITVEINDPNTIRRIGSLLSHMRDSWDHPIYDLSSIGLLFGATFFEGNEPALTISVYKNFLVAKVKNPVEKSTAVRSMTKAESRKIIDEFDGDLVLGNYDLYP